MTTVQSIAFGITALSAVGLIWPFLVYPAILKLFPERPVQTDAAAPIPTASLLFCAYNEEAALPAKIANLRALKARHPALEILAYDDGSSDATAGLLAGAGDILTAVRGPGRTGKAHGMKRLAARARGDILIFTDANVIFADDAIEHLLAPYADNGIGGALGMLHYTGDDTGSTAATGSAYWRLEERLKSLESRSGNVMGADGSIFSIRKTLYPEFPDTVLDDLTVSMAVVFAGRRLVKAPFAKAFETSAGDRADEFRRKTRIAARAWHTHAYLRTQLRAMSWLDRFKYSSRKITRWLGAGFIALGTVSTLVLAFTLSPTIAVAMIAIAIVLLVIGHRSRSGPLAVIADLASAYAAVAMGGWRALNGRTFATWTPPVSR